MSEFILLMRIIDLVIEEFDYAAELLIPSTYRERENIVLDILRRKIINFVEEYYHVSNIVN